MKVCKKCNKDNEANANFCEHCGEVLRKSNGVLKDKYVMNSNILLCEDEVNIRSYMCTKLNSLPFLNIISSSGNGYVSITNKRIIYYGERGRNNMFSSEVAIDTVTGFKTNKITKNKILSFLILLIITISATVYLSEEVNGFLATIVFIIGFIISLLASREKIYNFAVYSNGSQASVLDVNAGGFSTNIITNSIFSKFKINSNSIPAKDSIKLTNEIGAIVMDIKNLGDAAVEKWCTDNNI